MADAGSELNQLFASPTQQLPQDVAGELQSILRLHSLSAQELFYKWESYSIKIGGGEEIKLDLQRARDFKKDLQEVLERESRSKMAQNVRGNEKNRGYGATPRVVRSGSDMFGMIEGIVSETPRVPMSTVNGNVQKRKNNFQTPSSKAAKAHAGSSPGESKVDTPQGGFREVPFAERQGSGEVLDSINAGLSLPEAPAAPASKSRIALRALTDLEKFSYRPMAMKLSGISEVLDDRIDEFFDIVQRYHELDDGAFGNPAIQSTSEIVAVGRIASDAPESKLNANSVVLETSRRTGSGHRVPLKWDTESAVNLFPGKIVALKGTNASGEYFKVSEALDLPVLPTASSSSAELEAASLRLNSGETGSEPPPLSIVTASGPYTTENSLDYSALEEVCSRAAETNADALILLGPFLDIGNPIVSSGAFPESLLSHHSINSDTATLNDIFRVLISTPLQELAQQVPSITIILVPSVRDAINKHICWPQNRIPKAGLGLPKQATIATNPVVLSLNEVNVAISTQDILDELRREECVVEGRKPRDETQKNLLARLSRHLFEQRHFFPLFPPTSRDKLPKPAGDDSRAAGATLDISYLALGDMVNARPDVLITPSLLTPFVKVVESVVVVNPGQLMKKRGAGTFSRLLIGAREITQGEDAERVENKVYERARVDVVKI